MDREYDFKWVINEIDNSLIFMLRSGKEVLGSYYADSLKINGIDMVSIKFANINDLTNFVNYSLVRFVNSLDETNIIDIPIKKIYELITTVKNSDPEPIELEKLGSFAVLSDKVVSYGYAIVPYKVRDASDEFVDMVRKISEFDQLNMNQKIAVLEDINLMNYQKEKEGLKK